MKLNFDSNKSILPKPTETLVTENNNEEVKIDEIENNNFGDLTKEEFSKLSDKEKAECIAYAEKMANELSNLPEELPTSKDEWIETKNKIGKFVKAAGLIFYISSMGLHATASNNGAEKQLNPDAVTKTEMSSEAPAGQHFEGGDGNPNPDTFVVGQDSIAEQHIDNAKIMDDIHKAIDSEIKAKGAVEGDISYTETVKIIEIGGHTYTIYGQELNSVDQTVLSETLQGDPDVSSQGNNRDQFIISEDGMAKIVGQSSFVGDEFGLNTKQNLETIAKIIQDNPNLDSDNLAHKIHEVINPKSSAVLFSGLDGDTNSDKLLETMKNLTQEKVDDSLLKMSNNLNHLKTGELFDKAPLSEEQTSIAKTIAESDTRTDSEKIADSMTEINQDAVDHLIYNTKNIMAHGEQNILTAAEKAFEQFKGEQVKLRLDYYSSHGLSGIDALEKAKETFKSTYENTLPSDYYGQLFGNN